MQLTAGPYTYAWSDNWAHVPASPGARHGWSHHGIVVSETGDIVTYHPEDDLVMRYAPNGALKSSWKGNFADAHGMTLVKEGDTEYIWVADVGRKRLHKNRYEYPDPAAQFIGQAVKTTLDGQVVQKLPTPPLPVYESGSYLPTWVAVDEERHGGSGDVWVTDGYAANLVHRYTKDGKYLSSISGKEGKAGAFTCPHSIFIDRRKPAPELYVADRSNGRVQVYDLEGSWKRVFGADIFTTPSGFAVAGDVMVIAELNARLALLDIDDALIGYLGDNLPVTQTPGWPNQLGPDKVPVRTSLLEPGKFNSPHGITTDAHGNIYVAEWLIGGRLVRLTKA